MTDRVMTRSEFPAVEMAMAAYAENAKAYRQLFLDVKKHVVQAALADKLYRELS